MFRFCFNSKATQNARYEQMTKQQELIELKKQEIQKKLLEKKRKDTEEALKKLNPQAAAVVDTRGPSSSSNSRNRWRNIDRKRNSDVIKDEAPSEMPANIFSNDGSFLDQFRKITGIKAAPKVPKRSENYQTSNCDRDKPYSSSECKNINTSESGDIKSKEIKNNTSVNNSEQSDKIRSRRWDKSPEENSRHCSSSPSLPSQSLIAQASHGFHLQPLQPSHRSTLMPPLPPVPPPSYTQQNNLMTIYPLPIVPPPITTSSIPPPAPINPGTIPSPSPILPCSIPSPSPIQPSAIPPPSPIIPHSIPPPSPISPNMIPQPLPLPPHDIPPPPSPVKQHLDSPQIIVPPPLISQPPPTGIIMAPLLEETSKNFLPGDIPPLPPVVPSPSMSVIKYPIPEPKVKMEVQNIQMPIVPIEAQLPATVPAEQTVAEEGIAEEKDRAEEEFIKKVNLDLLEVKKEPVDKCEPLQNLHKPVEDCDGLKDVIIKKETHHSWSPSNDSQTSIPATYFAKEDDVPISGNMSLNEDSIKSIPLSDSYSIKFELVASDETEIKQEDLQQDDVSQDGDPSAIAAAARRKKRRSRWAPESEAIQTAVIPTVGPIGVVTPTVLGAASVNPPCNIPTINVPGMKGTLISQISRTDPALLQYAIKNFGSTQLTEEDWKKAEDHYKINLLYQDMLKKRRELERLQAAGKFKYEYDSDEETEGGTWEHKLREKEMVATQLWADELTEAAKGKHHIGDFLPPEELSRFMEKYEALKQGRPPDLSDYKEYKLKEDNIGFQMLQKLGWTEGQGLGSDGSGIVDPVNKATVRADNQGLGIERPEDVSVGDDEYDAYRKRMMLAYRFRPNPLNNPRRPYY